MDSATQKKVTGSPLAVLSNIFLRKRKEKRSFLFTAVLFVFLRPSPGDCDTTIVVSVVEEWKPRKHIIVLESEPYTERSYALFFFCRAGIWPRRVWYKRDSCTGSLFAGRPFWSGPWLRAKPHRVYAKRAVQELGPFAARQRELHTEHKCTAAKRSTSGFQSYVRVTAMY